MRTRTLHWLLEGADLRERLSGDPAGEAVVGIGRDPDDGRRNCVVIFVPPGFSRPLPETLQLGGEEVRVLRRERGGPLRAYAGKP